MKLKEKERITSELEVKARKNNIKVGKLKSEIAQYERQLKEQNALLNKKIKYNKKYTRFDDIIPKIKKYMTNKLNRINILIWLNGKEDEIEYIIKLIF